MKTGAKVGVNYVKYYGDKITKNEAEARENAVNRGFPEDVVLRQEEDVLDTWFSSGLFPFSPLKWARPASDLTQTTEQS